MARKDISMTEEEVAAFLGESRNIEVATLGPDGWPHVAPMWYSMRNGLVAFRSFTKSQKIVNLQRDPRLTLLAEDGKAYEELRGIMIKGEAELVDDPVVVLELYGELAARYPMVGEEPVALDDDALEAAFGRFAPKNTAVIVHPTTTVSWDHTKLAGAY
ncbi:MAG: pyridoxamine 5'-phosphate oxidase family protein [Acidimicrobiia bacterium]|nr:pyridoxamine 5'-phosphate oxidase family protein [Acidimicrobiia bacterium]